MPRDKIFEKGGYLDNGFVQTRFYGLRDDTLQFLTLSFDDNEEEWLVTIVFVSEGGVDFMGSPIEIFEKDKEEEAIKFFKDYKESWN